MRKIGIAAALSAAMALIASGASVAGIAGWKVVLGVTGLALIVWAGRLGPRGE